MTEAARRFVGKRDFRVFQASGSGVKSTVRTLLRLECLREGSRVCVTAEADAFLYQMVRRIVGALIAVGSGRLETEALERTLTVPESVRRPGPAPPCGLCLIRVSYGAD